MFTYAGSKHRLGVIASALRAVNTPVRVITDFDVLNQKDVVRKIVEALGHEYSEELERMRGVVDAALRKNERPLTVEEARRRLSELLSGQEGELTPEVSEQIRDATRGAGGWREAKRSGLAAVPAGDATVAVLELLELLEHRGVFVVRTGAVESFVKVVPHKSSRWVVEVVDGGHVSNATEALQFVGRVVSSFGARA